MHICIFVYVYTYMYMYMYMYVYIYIYIDPTPRRPNQSYPNMSDPHVVGSTCGRAVTLDTALSGRKMV